MQSNGRGVSVSVQRQNGAVPGRDAEVDPSGPDDSEEYRDSTGSVPDKMVDVTVVPVHKSTSWRGRSRSHSCSLYSKTMRSPSPDAQTSDWRAHLSVRFEVPDWESRDEHCGTQDDGAPQCMETEAYEQGRGPTHPGGVSSWHPSSRSAVVNSRSNLIPGPPIRITSRRLLRPGDLQKILTSNPCLKLNKFKNCSTVTTGCPDVQKSGIHALRNSASIR